MQNVKALFKELSGALYFYVDGVAYLYAGKDRELGIMYGILAEPAIGFPACVNAAGMRDYKAALKNASQFILDVKEFALAHVQIVTEGDSYEETAQEMGELQSMTVIDCRTPVGVTIGLIDGMIAMARVLRTSDLSSTEVQEALKDLRADEDMRFLMAGCGRVAP